MIYEDDLVCACHYAQSGTPEYLGYVVAQPKRHAKTFAELTDDEARAMGLLRSRGWRARSTTVAEPSAPMWSSTAR